MPHGRTDSSRSHPVATSCGVAAFAGYVVWNLYWLIQWRVPGSLLTAITGLPSPTTGGTRSFQCLCCGDWLGSLHYNAMTLPILVTLLASAVQVVRYGRVGSIVGYAWFVVLGTAWCLKFLSPGDTW